jgi:hypothetical protein
MWAEFDPAEYASLPAFRPIPKRSGGFYKPRIAMLTEAQPNARPPRARRARTGGASSRLL